MCANRTISIRDDQDEFLNKNHISLSRFVQDKIDELIKSNSFNVQPTQNKGGNST